MAPKPGSRRKVRQLKPLDFGKIKIAAVKPGQEMRNHRPTRGTRDEDQRQIDEIVKAGYASWEEAGKPEHWDDQPGTWVEVPEPLKAGQPVPDGLVDTVQARIRRAGAYLSMRIRFGELTDEHNVTQVVFTVTDPKVK